MSAPTAYALSQMFTQLMGREVSFTLKPKATALKSAPIYGVYKELPEEKPIVVQAELRLLASFGGALVGLPDQAVAEQAKEKPMGETLRDAIHEVFNISSTPLSVRQRVVFITMHTEEVYLSDSARDLLKSPVVTSSFAVSIAGYTGGDFNVLTGL